MTTPESVGVFICGFAGDCRSGFGAFFVLLDREGEGFEGAMIGAAVEKTASLPNLC